MGNGTRTNIGKISTGKHGKQRETLKVQDGTGREDLAGETTDRTSIQMHTQVILPILLYGSELYGTVRKSNADWQAHVQDGWSRLG